MDVDQPARNIINHNIRKELSLLYNIIVTYRGLFAIDNLVVIMTVTECVTDDVETVTKLKFFQSRKVARADVHRSP